MRRKPASEAHSDLTNRRRSARPVILSRAPGASEIAVVYRRSTLNLPTKIVPAKTRRLEPSRNFPLDMRIPPLNFQILLESNPRKSRISVRRWAVRGIGGLRLSRPSVSVTTWSVLVTCASTLGGGS